MVGFGENIGSGFPKIIAAWKGTNWGEPELKNKIELDEVELVLPVPAMGLRQGNGSFVSSNETKDETKQLSERQQLIVQIIQEDDTITINEMAQKANVAEITIKRELATLQEKNILTREGGRKDGHWVILKPQK